MINSKAPIIPGQGLGGISLGSRLPKGNWAAQLENLPWEFSWLDKGDELEPRVSEDQAVIAFVDSLEMVRLIYATPNYRGFLFNGLHPGMLGKDILSRQPDWKFQDFDASVVAPENIGVCFKHREFDLGDADWAGERFDFIAVFQPKV